jgi:hypothetical protein
MQHSPLDASMPAATPLFERRERRRNSQIRDIALWVGPTWETAEFIAVADFVVLPSRGDKIRVRAGAAAAIEGRILDFTHNVGGGEHQIDMLVQPA